jgi:predicted RecA/RadA family phage recombinase
MRNYIQVGNTLTIPAPIAVASGDVLVVGDLHGVVAGDAAEDEPCDLVTVGVFSLPKVGANSFAVGDKVYWDATSKLATSVESGNVHIGTCTKIAVAGSAAVETKLV